MKQQPKHVNSKTVQNLPIALTLAFISKATKAKKLERHHKNTLKIGRFYFGCFVTCQLPMY